MSEHNHPDHTPPLQQSTSLTKNTDQRTIHTTATSPTTTHLPKNLAIDSDQSLRVTLVVYDLLPPGRLADAAWLLGVGLYHTAIRIPAIGREIAFGGHPHPQLSGIFSLPIRSDGKPPLPGLRWLRDIDMGEVKTSQSINRIWTRTRVYDPRSQNSVDIIGANNHHKHEVRKLISNRSTQRTHTIKDYYPPTPSPSSSSTTPHLLLEPEAIRTSSSTSSTSSLSSSTSSLDKITPTHELNQMETLLKILEDLERSPDWRGTSYDLLRKNCNSFTDELCMLLTGKRIPKFINRAATVGLMLPCLVPTEWIEPPPVPNSNNQPQPSLSYQPPQNQMQIIQS